MTEPKVVNLEASQWSPEQVVRELTQMIDRGEVAAVVCAIAFTTEHFEKTGFALDWIGSKQNFQERVYLVSNLYWRLMERVFGRRQ